MVGVYYGKQESRTTKEEINKEMYLLKEEITEMSNEGEIILAMDGNAKIGILGEQISRNGMMLLDVFKTVNLSVINLSNKCSGKITRKNTKDNNEISAINFVVVSAEAEEWIESECTCCT